MEVSFVKHLRAEQKFASLDALKAQIARDIATARAVFRGAS
jgi:FAD synthase